MGKAGAGTGIAVLTDKQRELVEVNLGLVALHIRRNVRNLGGGRGERDFDDLFQEGCCGLMQAARTFDPARGIPFAAYALPRIHTAVSTALYENASLVRQPRRRSRRKSADPGVPSHGAGTFPDNIPPRVMTLDIDPPALRSRHDPNTLTVGDRIREKYDCAVELASRRALRRRGARDDRAELVRIIVEHRMMIAEESQRRALRQIARETGSSYSRVLQCEHRLHEEVRRALAGDLEFYRLREIARHSPEGLETEIDANLRGELRSLAAEEFWRKLNLHPKRVRDELKSGLLSKQSEATDELAVKRAVAASPRERADALLIMIGDENAVSARASRKSRSHPLGGNAGTGATSRRSSGRCRERVRGHSVE